MNKKKSIVLLCLFFQSLSCFSQLVFHVTINNTDSQLNVILTGRKVSVAATTASYEVVLNGLTSISVSLAAIRVQEYLTNHHDKSFAVETLFMAPYTALMLMPSVSPSFFPLYLTQAKLRYFETESALQVVIYADMNITGKGEKIRNANTQELYLLRREMNLNLKKTAKGPRRVYTFLFAIAILKKLIHPQLDPNLVQFLKIFS
ncbi:hypothetical protein OAC51_03900 [Flavobacteriaceae bacterium]|nr:hypothetical protein [Flavobacteriaceae bacterium]